MKRLNLETRNQENAKRGRLQEKIELQVDEFLAGLDKATRSQLSKTQLIKSLEKVNKWSVDNKKYLAASKTVPKEWMDLDLDPAEWSEKKPIPTVIPAPPPTNTPAAPAPAATGGASMLATTNSSRFPMFSSYAPRQQEVQFQLTGAIYERERAPKAPTEATQRITSRRTLKMKEWLVRRAGRQMDRDSIRKWIAGTAKNQNLLPEDVLKMYARKRRDLSSNELQQLLDMPVRYLILSLPSICTRITLMPFFSLSRDSQGFKRLVKRHLKFPQVPRNALFGKIHATKNGNFWKY